MHLAEFSRGSDLSIYIGCVLGLSGLTSGRVLSMTWIMGGATPREAIVLGGQYPVFAVEGFLGQNHHDNS